MLERDETAPTLPWRAGARCAAAPPSSHPAVAGDPVVDALRHTKSRRATSTTSTRPAGQRRTLASTDASTTPPPVKSPQRRTTSSSLLIGEVEVQAGACRDRVHQGL